MKFFLSLIYTICKVISAQVTTEDMQFLNELPLDKLLKLKNSLQDLVSPNYDNNITTNTTPYLQSFGAQAMAVKAPIKRTDFEESLQKTGSYSKISNIFSMSVTTLAFLAFGGYLLCLIVQAVKSKQMYNSVSVQPTTLFVNAGIKKRPQTQFVSYGRQRREARKFFKQIDLPPEQLFSALLQLCEGYAKWTEQYEEIHSF